MKCYNCGRTISRSDSHCEFCGALVKPTVDLVEHCAMGHKKAIAQLYKISYLQIYTELMIAGVGREEGKRLINRAFRSILKELVLYEDVDRYDELVRLVSRKVGRDYLERFEIAPLEQPYEDVYLKVTDDMIEDLFDYLQKRKPVTLTRKKSKRKHQWTKQDFIQLGILGGFVLVLVIVTSIIKLRNDASNNRRRDDTYVTIVKQYEAGVKKVNQNNETSDLDFSDSLCGDAISIAYSNSIHTKDLRCYIGDLDDDGHDDLLLGYQKSKKMVITGLYMNNNVSENATNTQAITSATQHLILTEDHQVIRNDNGMYHLLSLDGKDQYQVKKTIKNLETYLAKCKTSKREISGSTISSMISQYGKNRSFY